MTGAMTEGDVEINLVECAINQGEWRVEQINDDGSCEVAIFRGGQNQERATLWAEILRHMAKKNLVISEFIVEKA